MARVRIIHTSRDCCQIVHIINYTDVFYMAYKETLLRSCIELFLLCQQNREREREREISFR